jgi:hypothetical protein
MINKQKKWTAILVTVTFIWLLQVSAMPAGAADATEQIDSANAEQGPDFLEAIGHKAAPPKGKSILPYVLIGVGVVAVAAVLILVVFKTKYDIVGTWTFAFTGPYDVTVHYTFVGDKKSGTWSEVSGGDSGTYTMDGKDVTMTVSGSPETVFTGQFTGKDTMTGTWVWETMTWNFTATREMTTAGVKTPMSAQGIHRHSPGPSAAN